MRDRCRGVYALTLAAIVSATAPSAAVGQGFGLNDIGSCAVGRAYAATGAPCKDASVIFWNPGAAATLPGLSIYTGAAGIGVNGGFTADSTLHRYPGNAPISFPPHLFVNYTSHLGARAASVGLGVYVPYGLTSQWNSDFPGRFDAQKATLQTFYIQPNFSIDLVPHVLTIGGGPVIGQSSVELDQALDLSQAPVPLDTHITFGELGIPLGTEFGEGKVTGSATAAGWALGALYRPIPTLQIGARFLSPITFNYSSGTATFKQVPTGLVLAANNPLGLPAGTPVDGLLATQFATGGALVSQGASTKITHPLQAEGGIGFMGIPSVLVDLDVAFIGYDAFKTLPVIFSGPAALAGLSRTYLDDYGNSWAVRLGAEHVFGDSAKGITGRAGFSYATTPAPPETVTPILPDGNRYNVSIGAGVPLTRGVSLDAAYLHVFTRGRRGRVAELPCVTEQQSLCGEEVASESLAAQAYNAGTLNSGFYDLAADVVSLSLRLHF
jgi:long-chain fatty acid transport protein